jgi:hypothetical protein
MKFSVRDGIASTQYFNLSIYSDDYSIGATMGITRVEALELANTLIAKAHELQVKEAQEKTQVPPNKA